MSIQLLLPSYPMRLLNLGIVTHTEGVTIELEPTLEQEIHKGQVGCWGLVLKCYELRTRQHKMLNINALRPLKHYFPKDLINFGRRP
jgi:hypothetical protein